MATDIDFVIDVVMRQIPEAGIPCVMIGGHAVNHYGVIRATQDIDFMIAAPAADEVKRIMLASGFTNITVHETVMFFNQPGSPLRVDFLKVDQETMQKLMANAVKACYAGTEDVWVPRLHDLLAMKLFALATGGPKRRTKDFDDIVNLVIENGVDVENELRALSQEYGTDAHYSELRTRIEELGHV
ncbi:MAG: nucleotidyl transferase AbiEii/AbiGii toxin family protein [Verrucomicrobia bacterium]|nr:nucleotidyl transferase AbiEii/AbiGii toxin family protein [Verrucomicrobiota bacterium]